MGIGERDVNSNNLSTEKHLQSSFVEKQRARMNSSSLNARASIDYDQDELNSTLTSLYI